jgi:hypothetical protein
MENLISIPPEIKNDELYERIITTILMFSSEIKTVLEVGASSGDGSTEAIVLGMSSLKDKTLYTIEVNPLRYKNLTKRYEGVDWIKPINGSSVLINEYIPKDSVELFHKLTPTQLNEYPLETILSWYDDELSSIEEWEIPTGVMDGITPDIALLDGSPFCGYAEYLKVVGAKIIILDDIFDIKHHNSHQALRQNENYECLFCNLSLRNGYSIWVRKDIL